MSTETPAPTPAPEPEPEPPAEPDPERTAAEEDAMTQGMGPAADDPDA